MEAVLHKHPYNGTNNRKKTLARLKADMQIQSIPVFKPKLPYYENGKLIPSVLQGYKYIPRHVN